METTAPKAFVQVFINSENDLPKETGHYTVHPKQSSKWFTESVWYEERDNHYWLRNFEYWLKPVDPVSYGREEIIEKLRQLPLTTMLGYTIFNIHKFAEELATELSEPKDGVKESQNTKLSSQPTLKDFQECRLSGQVGGQVGGQVKESGNDVTNEEISAKLDSMNFETSKEREDAYDLCEWLRSRLHPAPPLTEERVNVKLNQIFECEGLLYSIAIPEKASIETNLSHGRIICEFIKT
jgi:hypothetical protein